MFRYFILCFVLLLTTGCAANSDFGCPGLPKGVTCLDPAQVYRLTEHRDHVNASDLKKAQKASNRSVAAASLPPGGGNLFTPPKGPMPVLEPAQVLRIWIAPWTDQKNDLHWPSYVFTEVTPRRWSLGGYGFQRVKALVPLQVTVDPVNPRKEDSQPTKHSESPIAKLFKPNSQQKRNSSGE